MVPRFVVVDGLPLMPNGKVDRQALSGMRLELETLAYIAPEDEFEWGLAEIWAEILNLDKDKISTNREFFEIGGHSLKATQMIVQIHKRFGVEIPLIDILRTSPTIKDIASSLRVILMLGKQPDEEKPVAQEIFI
jgi:acyl carrier protein